MVGEDGKIICKKCNFEASIDQKYNIVAKEGSFIPETPSKWMEWERRLVRKEVLNEEFCMKEKVLLGVLPDYKYLGKTETSQPAGEGMLMINREGLHFEGLKNGSPFSLFIESKNLPSFGMCTDASLFYTFAQNGEYYEFTPTETKTAIKWLLCAEEIHRINGGKWQNYTWFDYEDFTAGFKKF